MHRFGRGHICGTLYSAVRLACRFWPVRKYPWGVCEALSSAYSDVGSLKRLIFEEGYEELKMETDKRYYAYRSEQLLDDPSL